MTATSAPPDGALPGQGLRHSLATFGLWLFEPAAPFPEPVRRQARLLSGLLLALLLLTVVGIGIIYLTLSPNNPLPGPTLPVTALGTALLLFAYFLNRRGRYAQAAGLTVTVTALGVWAAVIANRDSVASSPFLMLYLLLSVLLSSLLLSPRVTALLAAGHLLGIVLASTFVPGLGPDVIVNSILFIGFTSLITIVGASLRQRDQAQLMDKTRALGENEQRFRLLFTASPDAVLLIDPHDSQVDWPIVDCNEAAGRMNGFTCAELVGQSIDILNASPGEPQERAAYLERLRIEPEVHLEATHRRKDGTLFPVEVSTSLVNMSGRELILGIDRDVTERQQEEQRMRTMSDILRALNATPQVADAFPSIASQLKLITGCERMSLALGDDHQEWFTMTALDRSHAEVGAGVRFRLSDIAAADDLLAGRPHLTPDLAAETTFPIARALYEAGYGSRLSLPLRHGDELLGMLNFAWRQPAGYDVTHFPLLGQIAEALSLATARSRAFETERRLRARAQTLQKLGSLVASSLDLSEVLNTIAQQVLELMEVPVCTLMLWETPDDLVCKVNLGLDDEETQSMRQKVGRGLAGWVAARRQPLIVEEILADERTAFRELAERSHLRAYLGVPLEAKGHLVGTLDICTREPRHFGEDEAALLVAIAGQATLAIENARLFDETQRRAQEAETLRQAGAVVASTLQQAEAIERILEQLARVVPHDSASVQLLRAGPPGYLELVGGRGWPDSQAVMGLRIPVPGDNPNSAVIQERRLVNLGNAPAEHAGLWEGPHSYIKSWLGVPLIVYDRVIGMLTLDSARANAFTSSHVRLVGAFADQVAIALEHARLFTETQQRAAELQAANQELENGIAERQATEQALESANQQLIARIEELQRRTHDSALLNEMSDLLQACLTVDEAYGVIARLGRQLFPDESGRLYMLSASRSLLELATTWGAALPDPNLFEPNDCWGLRRGRLHLIEREAIAIGDTEGNPALVCRHLEPPWPVAYVCVPLVAQGEGLGVLHMRRPPPVGPASPSDAPGPWFGEAKQQLIQTVTDSLALALANLKLRASLRQQSIRDPLTGLFNRRYLEETLDREVQRAARRQGPVGIIMLDLDHFKTFNDTFGHEAGDTALRELGTLLRTQIRAEDIACRYGGEEFTLIMPEASLVVTRQRAEHVREQVKHLSVQHRGRPLGTITVSLGVAAYPDHGATGDVVLRAADAALYRAKHAGRDRVVAEPGMDRPD